MLISFNVENFKSVRDLQTLSLEAGGGDHLELSHTMEALTEAMVWFRQFVVNSSKEGQSGERIEIEPFRLCTETENAPTHFEAEFFWNGFEYRYGFEVTAEAVQSEWLFRKTPGTKAAKLFTRDGEAFEVSPKYFKEGKGLEKRTRKNALFLSVCAQFNGEVAMEIMNWMVRFRHASGLSEIGFFLFTAERLQSEQHKEGLLDLAKKADFDIQSLSSEIEEIKETDLPSSMPVEMRQRLLSEKVMRADIRTTHHKRDGKNQIIGTVEFDLEDESDGTQKFIALSGPVSHTLEEGSILVVDELEARLHPRLTQAIVDLFHSPVNRRKAQLICATHDVTLMDPDRFRRDQIWFCEKDETGATDLYSLADFSKDQVRPTSKFSRQYMLGLFGAVPKLAHFQEAAAHAASE